MARYSFLPASALVGVDMILSHITFPFLLARGHGPPIIWSTQGISPPSYYDYIGRVKFEDVVSVASFFAARADRLLVWTHSGAEMMRRHCRCLKPIHVVPPAVPPPVLAAKALAREAEMHLLFIGRDPKRKGLYDVLRAFEKLSDGAKRVQFDIVSCVPKSVREAFCSHRNIRFHESLPDEGVNRLFDRADIFVFPTYADTYGFVLIEAMARGCAIVTCDYAPLNELVENGQNGLVVPPGDVEAIAQALATLLGDPPLVRRFADNNRQKYWNTFSPNQVAAELEKVLCA
jgi:glycosyltransferase involved in cell wall biosynthesis